MTPLNFIEKALVVPHVPGGGAWSGADCWGIIELWYRELYGVELSERQSIPAGPDGLTEGFDLHAQQWTKIDKPVDGCLVLMRSGALPYGHIGVYYHGHILHSGESYGCVCEPESRLRRRITAYFKRRK